MPNNITITKDVAQEDFLKAVRLDGLLQYNMEKTGGRLKQPDCELTRVARDARGTIVGGAQGSAHLSSLEVEVLWVAEAFRGQGVAACLLADLEAEAKALGCRLAHLTTYSFQAPGFYQKQGYEICGEVDGFPDGIKLYMMQKSL